MALDYLFRTSPSALLQFFGAAALQPAQALEELQHHGLLGFGVLDGHLKLLLSSGQLRPLHALKLRRKGQRARRKTGAGHRKGEVLSGSNFAPLARFGFTMERLHCVYKKSNYAHNKFFLLKGFGYSR